MSLIRYHLISVLQRVIIFVSAYYSYILLFIVPYIRSCAIQVVPYHTIPYHTVPYKSCHAIPCHRAIQVSSKTVHEPQLKPVFNFTYHINNQLGLSSWHQTHCCLQ